MGCLPNATGEADLTLKADFIHSAQLQLIIPFLPRVEEITPPEPVTLLNDVSGPKVTAEETPSSTGRRLKTPAKLV